MTLSAEMATMNLSTEMDSPSCPKQRISQQQNENSGRSSKLVEFNQSDIGGIGDFDIHSLLADSILPLQTNVQGVGSNSNENNFNSSISQKFLQETQKVVVETIREEITHLRSEISEMTLNIKQYESNDEFDAEDARYKRWVATKRVLQANMHELLVSMAGSLQNEGGAVVSRQEKTVRNVLDFLDNANSSSSSTTGAVADWHNGSSSGSDSIKDVIKMTPEEVESELSATDGLQLNAYKFMKERLAQIMRDFSVNTIHFKSKEDGSDVFVRQFQLIKNAGEKIESALQGTLHSFRIGINKKTKEYATARLFIPVYEGTYPGPKK